LKTTSKLLIGILITVFLVSAISPALAIPKDKAQAENREGSIIIETPYLNVKLQSGRPDLFLWAKNSTDSKRTPVFHLSFDHIGELFGDDLIVDSRTEIGGKIYNLASSALEWTVTVENFTNELRVTQTSDPVANGAIITFVYHVYLEDATITQDLNGTIVTYETKALSEVKFDIIVENWKFSPEAVGLLFHMKVHELHYRHRVRSGEMVNNPEEKQRMNESETTKTYRSQNPERNGIEFRDDKDRRFAYFAWAPEADIFDENGTYVKTINCTASAVSYGFDNNFGRGYRFGMDFINLVLVYPNYGDGLKLVHDPILGIDSSTTLNSTWIALLAIPVAGFAVLVIKRKRK